MSNRKRFLAVVLAVMMVVSTMATMGVSAATRFADVPTSDKELTQALSVLSDLGIVKGTGADPETGDMLFSGDAPVTRQQFALFVARLETGTPEYFVADPDSPTVFEDVVDPTFFTAINHCVEKGIINGYPDGSFKPNNPIQFQEAMKMLVTALGYTSLSYPQGYLSKAKEDSVALIGNWVQTKGFDFTNATLTYELTRNDMGMLLYNFLLTNYNKLGSIWNGVTGQYEPITDTTPVISKFGITPYMGYVTAVQNYATRLDIDDYNRTGLSTTFVGSPITERQADKAVTTNPRDLQISYGNEGAITAAQREKAGSFSGQDNLYVTYADLGMTKPTDGEDLLNLSLELLGLKIIVYRHTAKTANTANIALPAAVVLGTKTLVDNSLNAATAGETTTVKADTTIPVRGISGVDELTLGTDTDGEKQTYNQRQSGGGAYGSNPKDLSLTFNLYAFTEHGYLVSDNGNKRETRMTSGGETVIPGYLKPTTNATTGITTWEWVPQSVVSAQYTAENDIVATGNPATGSTNGQIRSGSRLVLSEDSIEKELARFIKGKGHYELYYVNNGTKRDGTPEFYYVFIPYRVGVLWENTATNIRLTNQTWDGGYDFRIWDDNSRKYDSSNTNRTKVWSGYNEITLPTGSGESWRKENSGAYLFTFFGNHYKDLVVKEELVRAAKDVEVSETRNPSSSSASVSFTNTNYTTRSFNFETGSKAQGAYQGSDIVRQRFQPRNRYNVYEDSDGVVLAALRTHEPASADRTFRYGVIMSDTFATVGYANGSIGYNYLVYNSETGRQESMILRPVNGVAEAGGIGGNTSLRGTFVGFIRLDDNSYDAVVIGSSADSKAVPALAKDKTALARQGDTYRYGWWNESTAAINPANDSFAGSMGNLQIGSTNRYDFSRALDGVSSATSETITGTTNNSQTLITSATRIIAYTDDANGDGNNGDPGAGIYLATNMPQRNVLSAGFVSSGSGTNTNVANVVFIRVDGRITTTVSRENYATILNQDVHSNLVINGVRYDGRKAYVYNASGDSRIVNVCAPSGSDLLNVGRTVILSDVTRNDGTTTFREIRESDDPGTAASGRLATSNLLTGKNNIVAALNASYNAAGTGSFMTEQDIIALETQRMNELLTQLTALENIDPDSHYLDAALNGTVNMRTALTPAITFGDAADDNNYNITGGTPVVNAIEAREYLVREILEVGQLTAYTAPRISNNARNRLSSAIAILDLVKVEEPLNNATAAVNSVITALNNYRDALLSTVGTPVSGSAEGNVYGRTDSGVTTTTVAGRVTQYSAANSMTITGNNAAAGGLNGNVAINLAGLPNVYRTIYVRLNPNRSSTSNAQLDRPGTWDSGDVLITERMGNSELSSLGATGLWAMPNDLFTHSDRAQSFANTYAVVTYDNQTREPVAITFFVGVPNDRWTGNWNDYTWR